MRRDRPRYISDHPAMALVMPALAALLLALVLLVAVAAKADTVYDARRAAAADRHRDAITLYQEAIDEHPEWRVRLARELGNQYTWADEPDTAIAYFRTYLNVFPDDLEARLGLARALSWAGRYDQSLQRYREIEAEGGEGAVEARLGIARVLSWQDKLWPSRRVYESILDDDPENLNARIGRARVINWAGRHREAQRLFAQLLEEEPDNAEIREGLAAAYYWMGRPDVAMKVIEGHADSRPLARLAGDIRRDRDPGASYVFSHNEDSDDVERDIHTGRVEYSPAWLTRLGLQYAHAEITQPGLPEVTRDQVLGSLSQRFGAALAATVNAGWETNGYNRSALGPEPYWRDEHDLFLLDAWVTITPTDWVRSDLGVSRGSIDNPLPVFRGITVTQYSAGLDWRLAPTVLSVTSGSWADYSDDNSRLALGQRVDWSPAQRLPVPLQHRFTFSTGVAWYDFDNTLDDGYYNPDRYTSLYEVVAVTVSFGPRVHLDARGRIAAERENSADWFATGSFEASASWRAARYLEFRAGYYNSRSRLDTRSGYESDGFFVGVGL